MMYSLGLFLHKPAENAHNHEEKNTFASLGIILYLGIALEGVIQ